MSLGWGCQLGELTACFLPDPCIVHRERIRLAIGRAGGVGWEAIDSGVDSGGRFGGSIREGIDSEAEAGSIHEQSVSSRDRFEAGLIRDRADSRQG